MYANTQPLPPLTPSPQGSHMSPMAGLGLPGVKGCKGEEKDIFRAVWAEDEGWGRASVGLENLCS